MVDALVLDASALCKLFRREPESSDVVRKIRRHLEQGGEVWTDPMAAIEAVTCARKAVEAGEGSQEHVSRALRDAFAVPTMRPRDEADHDVSALLRLACETGLSGPDARYVELALGHRLLTFDAKQADAAKKNGVQLA